MEGDIIYYQVLNGKTTRQRVVQNLPTLYSFTVLPPAKVLPQGDLNNAHPRLEKTIVVQDFGLKLPSRTWQVALPPAKVLPQGDLSNAHPRLEKTIVVQDFGLKLPSRTFYPFLSLPQET
ncbi:hypothetical protein M23134_05282 [Microscilla marina ATCC 23134]|uniref:Uncharacterized protein n=1 Tax=Microscilla marina ATCC 23134 TaxID=313606 RepID=A1ZDN7_MICM2|nr:hypothetical protein M23134_05282 [Microscilla marina ATCC 23134]